MNKLGIFMNFWEKNWAADHAKYIRKAAEIGFDILEFQAQPLLDMDKQQLLHLKELAAEYGIEMTYSLGLDPRYDVSSADETVRRGGVDYLQRIVEKIGILEGKLLSGVSYAGWGSPNYIVDDKTAIVERSKKSMRDIVKTAENYGVTYCVEAVNRFEGCIINTAQEALDYVNDIDSPNIGVLLDTYHMNIEERSIGDAIRLVGDKLTSFHTGENNRMPPGKGHLNWDEIFGALSDIHYKGRIVSEPFVMMGGEVGRDIKVWRNLVADPTEKGIDAEAAGLLQFTKDMLKKYNMA
mgnify:CR=1 FL=1